MGHGPDHPDQRRIGHDVTGLDPFYVERFAVAGDVTWDQVYAGDADAIERAIAYGAPAGPYAPPPLEIRDVLATGPHGPVPVRVYTAANTEDRAACLVWMHGGAFQFGDLDMLEAHAVAAELAHRLRSVVVSVDYRLAPAFRYPVPVDDCLAALVWVADQSAVLGVDPRRIAIGGASAGANLATATALRLLHEGGPQPRAVVLAYPAVHRDIPAPSPELAERLPLLPPLARFTPAMREQIYRAYLGDKFDEQPTYGVPALADLAGLPPFVIANAEYDDLRPSGEAFAMLLREQGVEVDEWTEPGTAHGYLNAVGYVAGAKATIDRFALRLRDHLA